MADWVEAMYPIAIGELGLTVIQIEALTPRELQWKYEAARDSERRALRRLAQLAVWVMGPWLDKPVTASELMGEPSRTHAAMPWQDE